MMLGFQQAVFTAGGALGPIAAGALLGATGSYTPAITIISAGFARSGQPAPARPCTRASRGQRPTAVQDGR